jgi:FAD synthase
VVPGEQRGRQLGWPTANVEVSGSELPPDGIFAAWVDINGVAGPRAAAVSVGTNPTFAGTSRCVEAHLLDFDDDIYGAQVTVRATHWLRETRAFDSVPDLLEAITADVAQVRALLCRP